MWRLCERPGATNADEKVSTPRYTAKARHMARVRRGGRLRLLKRPLARRTTATTRMAGISGRIVPSGVSSVALDIDAIRNRIPRQRRGRERAVRPAARAANAATARMAELSSID